jgi:cytochrome c peroxidase
MKKRLIAILLIINGLVACHQAEPTVKIQYRLPKNFPPPFYNLAANPITPEGFALGKQLFYDGILSRDGTVACGTCHQQSSAFTHHGHDLSHGIDNKLGKRNSPPIMNMAWHPTFFWDGGVHDLDLQPIAPIENPVEMDEKLANVLNKLRNHPQYPQKFAQVFGSSEITTDKVMKALSQFMLMLVSADSRYDKYIRNEGGQLSEDELAGLAIFKHKCGSCHSGELFSDFSFRNNGLFLAPIPDKGRGLITLNPLDDYKFKVPSLRNIEKTAPYMHDGSIRNLEGVLEHYTSFVQDTPNLDPLLKQNNKLGIQLTESEKNKVIAFLKTLTDANFLTDKRFSEDGFTSN